MRHVILGLTFVSLRHELVPVQKKRIITVTVDVDPVVYPFFELYNSLPAEAWFAKDVVVKLDKKYPNLDICMLHLYFFICQLDSCLLDPIIYPSFEIYPGFVIEPQVNTTKVLSVKLRAEYPSFEICT